MQILDFKRRHQRGLINPFESLSPLDWCKTCQIEVSTETDKGSFRNVKVYRKRCLRCGRIIQWGIDRTVLFSGDPETMATAKAWVATIGRDRR